MHSIFFHRFFRECSHYRDKCISLSHSCIKCMKFDVAPCFYSPVNKNEGQNGQKRMRDLYGWRELMNTDGNRRKREIREVREGTESNERQQKHSKAGRKLRQKSVLDQSKNSRLNYKACSRSTIVRRAECPNHNTRPFASNKTLNGTNRTPYALNVLPASSKATAKA